MKNQKNKKNKLFTILGILFVLIVSFTLYFIFRDKKESYDLTLIEKRWIENNKNRVVDVAMPNDIPIFDILSTRASENTGIYYYINKFSAHGFNVNNRLSASPPTAPGKPDDKYGTIPQDDGGSQPRRRRLARGRTDFNMKGRGI